jgi:hypothetical protein
MMTIERQKWLTNDNYKNYLIKCSVTDTTTRFHTRHGEEPWQRYAVLIAGLETMEVERRVFARMLKRIRTDNRENYKKTA